MRGLTERVKLWLLRGLSAFCADPRSASSPPLLPQLPLSPARPSPTPPGEGRYFPSQPQTTPTEARGPLRPHTPPGPGPLRPCAPPHPHTYTAPGLALIGPGGAGGDYFVPGRRWWSGAGGGDGDTPSDAPYTAGPVSPGPRPGAPSLGSAGPGPRRARRPNMATAGAAFLGAGRCRRPAR